MVDKNSEKLCPVCEEVNSITNNICLSCQYEFIDETNKVFEISRTMQSHSAVVWCIVICAVAFFSLATVGAFTEGGITAGIIVLVIVIVLSVLFIWYAIDFSSGTRKIRRITVSDKKIEISIPNKPFFHIKWSDFDIIEVIKIDREYGNYYNLIFKGGKDFYRDFEFREGTDFPKASIEVIFRKLQEYSESINKTFIGHETKDFQEKTSEELSKKWKDRLK